VTDNGPGQPAGNQARASWPFFSDKGSLAKGLGLSMANDIVQGFGGRLDVTSNVDLGTSVSVHLPTAQLSDSGYVRTDAPGRTGKRPS
jgi:signal transduction histidine kinase